MMKFQEDIVDREATRAYEEMQKCGISGGTDGGTMRRFIERMIKEAKEGAAAEADGLYRIPNLPDKGGRCLRWGDIVMYEKYGDYYAVADVYNHWGVYDDQKVVGLVLLKQTADNRFAWSGDVYEAHQMYWEHIPAEGKPYIIEDRRYPRGGIWQKLATVDIRSCGTPLPEADVWGHIMDLREAGVREQASGLDVSCDLLRRQTDIGDICRWTGYVYFQALQLADHEHRLSKAAGFRPLWADVPPGGIKEQAGKDGQQRSRSPER